MSRNIEDEDATGLLLLLRFSVTTKDRERLASGLPIKGFLSRLTIFKV